MRVDLKIDAAAAVEERMVERVLEERMMHIVGMCW